MAASWNYRVILCPQDKDQPEVLQIHEVEYNEAGKAVNWSETGASPFGGNLEELKDDAERLLTAFDKPVCKVVRKQRGYELVEVDTGDQATS